MARSFLEAPAPGGAWFESASESGCESFAAVRGRRLPPVRPLRSHRTIFISDTHLGSVAERLELVNEAYDTFAEAGISHVFHMGD